MVLIAAIFALGAAPAAPPTATAAVLGSFTELCAADPALGPVLARADTAGWLNGGPGAPDDFRPQTDRFKLTSQGVLRLRVTVKVNRGEKRDACGVAIFSPASGLVDATKQWLGFPPAYQNGLSATFLALNTAGGWWSGSYLNQADFRKARKEGAFSSIMVFGGDDKSALVLVRARRFDDVPAPPH